MRHDWQGTVWSVCVCVNRVSVEQNMAWGREGKARCRGRRKGATGRQQNAETRGGGALSCCLRVGSARAFGVVVVCE